MKRRIARSLLIAILVLASSLSLVSIAAADDDRIARAEELYNQGIINHQESVDVLSCQITVEECLEMLNGFYGSHPYAFVTEMQTSYSYNSDGFVTKLNPSYLDAFKDADAADKAIKAAEKAVKDIVYSFPSSLSVPEKLLLLHDHIALGYEYDGSLKNSDLYSFITTKKGVCNAYCMMFIACCQEMGVECELVGSESMNHAWVRAKIDGNWYHVDVTFDDPTADRIGRVNHDYFLVSDTKLSSLKSHYGFETGFCTSSKYDEAFWRCSSAPAVKLGSDWYVVDKDSCVIHKCSFQSASKAQAFKFDSLWTFGDNGYWPGCHSGLAANDGKLLYNTRNEIREFDPSSGSDRLVQSSDKPIYALYKDSDGALYYVNADDPNGHGQSKHSFTVNAPVYTVRFISEGYTVKILSVVPDDKIEEPSEIPVKPSNAEGRFEFSHWEGFNDGMKVNSDTDFNAVFNFVPYTTQTARPTSSTAKRTSRSTAPRTTAPASTSAPSSSSAPSTSSVPASSAAVTTVPATTLIPQSSSDVPGAEVSTRDETVPTVPGSYGPDQNPEVIHSIPQGRTLPNGSVIYPSDEADHSGVSNEDPKDNAGFKAALPWIIAVCGSLIVVGAIIVFERVIQPKRRARAERNRTEDDNTNQNDNNQNDNNNAQQ